MRMLICGGRNFQASGYTRRQHLDIAVLAVCALVAFALLKPAQPRRFALTIPAKWTQSGPLVEKLPRCLSKWREVRGGHYVMVATYRVHQPGFEITVETVDGSPLGVVKNGEERQWTCDWPAQRIPHFDPAFWGWDDA